MSFPPLSLSISQILTRRASLEKENEKEKKRKKCSSNEGLQIALPDVITAAIEGIGKGKKREMTEAGEEEGLVNVRWLRVNTLKWSVEDCVEWFESERWELVDDIDMLLEMRYVSTPPCAYMY